MSQSVDSGVYLLHKPAGPTSFSLVRQWIDAARLIEAHKRPRICHGGTLDPFAEGLLIMLAGPATRLFDFLHAVPKVYDVTIRWGIETDNGDPLGKVTQSGDASAIGIDTIECAMAESVGWHEQTPPATSAKRIGGERAYARAHRGETVELPPARVYLHEALWLGHDGFEGGGSRQSRVRLTVRGGYYIRSLVRDLGRRLGCGAHTSALRRQAIGPWQDPGEGSQVRLSARDVLPWLPRRELSDWELGELRQARAIAAGTLLPADWPLPPGFPGENETVIRAFHQGRLPFLLRPDGGKLAPAVALGRGL